MQRDLADLNGPFPVLQVALDFVDADRAVTLAAEAVAGGVDWLEAGTPLLKSEGMEALRRLRRNFPRHVIVADLKTMDAGRVEVEAAAKAGANICVCLAAAADSTIEECVSAGLKYGVKIYCDTIALPDPVTRVQEVEKLGVDYIGVHCPVDDQMRGGNPLERLRAIRAVTKLPIAVAGGISGDTAASMVENGASIIIVGSALTKAADARDVAAKLRIAVDSRVVVEGAKRRVASYSEAGIRETLSNVSASNLSDAMHHQPGLRGIMARTPGLRAVGPALVVKTLPGDWNKVVQAIDLARPGQVLVVDAGGIPPAVWGEMATRSAIVQQLSGTVIAGAIRDTDVALTLNYPLWSSHVCPDAGEPRGYGEIGGQVRIAEQLIQDGDWIVADDDGVIVLPKLKAVEYANRAQDTKETEDRQRAEILSGSTLAKVAHLARWEKQ